MEYVYVTTSYLQIKLFSTTDNPLICKSKDCDNFEMGYVYTVMSSVYFLSARGRPFLNTKLRQPTLCGFLMVSNTSTKCAQIKVGKDKVEVDERLRKEDDFVCDP